MASKYEIFCKVVETGSFTKVADMLNYSQSAVSQSVKNLEGELGTALVTRDKSGIQLTSDGKAYFPFIESLNLSEAALEKKHTEMMGLDNAIIRIGTFTSVSRNVLPPLMSRFKEKYPSVRFELCQGEYTNIAEWIKNGTVDLGFVNSDAVSDLGEMLLMNDEMFAVLPKSHPLAKENEISLGMLAKEPFILLDEGNYSVPVVAFQKYGLSPNIEYKVYDDYSILAMVRQNLGVSLIYRLVLSGINTDLAIRRVKEKPQRTIALAWNSRDTVSIAAKRFADFISDEFDKIKNSFDNFNFVI